MEKNSLDVVSIRLVRDTKILSETPVTNPREAVDLLGKYLRDMDREVVCVLNTTTDGKPINCTFASVGTLNNSLVEPREILKSSILSNAASMIMLHNHPSGSLTPSKMDTQITDRMINACDLIGIPLMDHIIVGSKENEYYSYREQNILPASRLFFETDAEHIRFKSAVAEEKHDYLTTDKTRLFVDMDGTLARFFPESSLDDLYKEGYFRNLPPHQNVVNAVKDIVKNEPDIEVFVLSAYLTDSPYALQEKEGWMDEHLPEIDKDHRVFVPNGSDKSRYIGELKETDALLDDYTRNLKNWNHGKGIKLLTDINHTNGSWQGDRIAYDRKDLAKALARSVKGLEEIKDEKPGPVNEPPRGDNHSSLTQNEEVISIPPITVGAEVLFFEEERPEDYKLYEEQRQTTENAYKSIILDPSFIGLEIQMEKRTLILTKSVRDGVDYQLSFMDQHGDAVMHEDYYIDKNNPEIIKGNSHQTLFDRLANYSHDGAEIQARVLRDNEKGDMDMAENMITFQAASKSAYKGYTVLSQYDRDGRSNTPERVYLGKSENYDNHGNYDNSDYSLIYLSENYKIHRFFDASSGWVNSQQEMLKEGMFSVSDYAEYAYIRENILKDLPEANAKRFSIDMDKWEQKQETGVPFTYPNWEGRTLEIEAKTVREQTFERMTYSDRAQWAYQNVNDSANYLIWSARFDEARTAYEIMGENDSPMQMFMQRREHCQNLARENREAGSEDMARQWEARAEEISMVIDAMELEQKQKEYEGHSVSFFVAEANEIHQLGEFHEGLTLKEAFDIYDSILTERLNGLKTIGITLNAPGNNYDESETDLFVAGKVQEEYIEMIDFFRDHPLIQKALADVKAEATARYGVREQEAPASPIQNYYVVEDLQVRGPLIITRYNDLETAMNAYLSLSGEKMKALGIELNSDLPRSLDFIQCRDGRDVIIEDYLKVDGWDMPEINEALEIMENTLANQNMQNRDGIKIEGHRGTWHAVGQNTITIYESEGDKKSAVYYLMEHDTYGEDAPMLIVNSDNQLVLEDVYNGFDDLSDRVEDFAETLNTLEAAGFEVVDVKDTFTCSVKDIDGNIKTFDDYDALIGAERYLVEEIYDRVIDAMEMAGYHLDNYASTSARPVYNYEAQVLPLEFDSLKANIEWLDGVVFDDPEISRKVDFVMHKEQGYEARLYAINGISEQEVRNTLELLRDYSLEQIRVELDERDGNDEQAVEGSDFAKYSFYDLGRAEKILLEDDKNLSERMELGEKLIAEWENANGNVMFKDNGETSVYRLMRDTSISLEELEARIRAELFPEPNIICFDIETTGFSYNDDEILQLSIMNGKGEVLFNEYMRPEFVTSWEETQAVNGISPEMVADKKPFREHLTEINEIFAKADVIVGYNSNYFDIPFIKNAGAVIPARTQSFDVMKKVARLNGEWDARHNDYRWIKLSAAAERFGFQNEGNFHDSLEDVRATLFIYHAMQEREKEANELVANLSEREQRQIIFESEVANQIPEEYRMTRWYTEENIAVQKPYYGPQEAPISQALIEERCSEILQGHDREAIHEKYDEVAYANKFALVEDIKHAISDLQEKAASDMFRQNSPWGSWFGRIANPFRPEDYIMLDITGYSTRNSVIASATLVLGNNVQDNITLPEVNTTSYMSGEYGEADLLSFAEKLAERFDPSMGEQYVFYNPHGIGDYTLDDHYQELHNMGHSDMPDYESYNVKRQVQSLKENFNLNDLETELDARDNTAVDGLRNDALARYSYAVLWQAVRELQDEPERDHSFTAPKENSYAGGEFYRYFYDYNVTDAEKFQAENGWKMFWGSDYQGLNGGTYVVYREIRDLPETLREYAKEQEDIALRQRGDNIYRDIIHTVVNQTIAMHEEFARDMEMAGAYVRGVDISLTGRQAEREWEHQRDRGHTWDVGENERTVDKDGMFLREYGRHNDIKDAIMLGLEKGVAEEDIKELISVWDGEIFTKAEDLSMAFDNSFEGIVPLNVYDYRETLYKMYGISLENVEMEMLRGFDGYELYLYEGEMYLQAKQVNGYSDIFWLDAKNSVKRLINADFDLDSDKVASDIKGFAKSPDKNEALIIPSLRDQHIEELIQMTEVYGIRELFEEIAEREENGSILNERFGSYSYEELKGAMQEFKKDKFRYFSTERPVSIGTYPIDGMISFVNYNERTYAEEIGREAWGELYYNRELSEKETRDYELMPDFTNQTIVIDGYDCMVIDKWQDGTSEYILGENAGDDGNFYYARVTENEESVKGNYSYEFDERPERKDVEDRHLDHISEIAIDQHEAEFGADGSRAFPNLNNEEPKMLNNVTLQKDSIRYTFRYDNERENYAVQREEMYVTGASMSTQRLNPERALARFNELKEQGFLQFRNAQEVSWYATRYNNTPYPEVWETKDGYLVPIESRSAGISRQLTFKDFEGLDCINSRVNTVLMQTEATFVATVHGVEQELSYIESVRDGEKHYSIYMGDRDLSREMSKEELERLEDTLAEESSVYRFINEIQNAKTLEETAVIRNWIDGSERLSDTIQAEMKELLTIKENKLREEQVVDVEANYKLDPVGRDEWIYNEPDSQRITWIYFNPDSNAGGQYVETHIDYDQLKQAKRDADRDADLGSDDAIMELLGENQAFLTDIDTPEFSAMAKDLSENPPQYVIKSDREGDGHVLAVVNGILENIAYRELAERIDEFTYENLPYEYKDQIEDREEHIAQVESCLRDHDEKLNGVIASIKADRDEWFDTDEGIGNFSEDIREADDLIYSMEHMDEYLAHYSRSGEANAKYPIREFANNGRHLEGDQIPMAKSSTRGFSDRSIVFYAVQDFERENNIPMEQRVIVEGSYEDKEFLYDGYDRYVAMSHQNDLSLQPYMARINDLLAKNETPEHYRLSLIAEVYYAQKNNLSREDIDYLFTAVENEKYPQDKMRDLRRGLESGLTTEQLDLVKDEEHFNREDLMGLMLEGASLEDAKLLKGAEQGEFFYLKDHVKNKTIRPEVIRAIVDAGASMRAWNKADYERQRVENPDNISPRFGYMDSDYLAEYLADVASRDKEITPENISLFMADYLNQREESVIPKFIEERGGLKNFTSDNPHPHRDSVKRFEKFLSDHEAFLKSKENGKQTLVINAFGGAGAGKTTACHQIVSELKKAGYTAEYVSEYAKDLVWDENWEMLNGTEAHQFEILTEQLKRMDRLYGKVDFIVTDAPVLLNYVYNNELTEDYDQMLTDLNNQYSSFNFFVQRDESKYEQEGRVQNLEEAKEKDNQIKSMLKEKGIYFGSYKHENISKVTNNAIRNFANRAEEKAEAKEQAVPEQKEEKKVTPDKKEEQVKERSEDMAKKTSSQEDKPSAKEVLQEKLQSGVKEILDSENFKRWLDTNSHMFTRNYSFNNAILIWAQKQDASIVMGFEDWKEYGRSVEKGAKAIQIYVPVIAYEKKDGDLWRMIKSALDKGDKNNPDLELPNYRIGMSSIEITKNDNGLYGLKIGGREMGIKTEKEMKAFIRDSVIGKTPMYFTSGNVFDVKDTVVPETLWLRENKVLKTDKHVLDDKGEPKFYLTKGKNPVKVYEVYNSDERKNRFVTSLDMKVTEIPKEKADILYDALKAVSERNGIHVYEKAREDDDTLKGGADGYFSRAFSDENPKGFIVMPTDLEPTRAVSVLLHEMSHSDLHGNLEKLAQDMGEDNIPRNMREVQAEAVAYMVGKNYGIEAETASFQYLAAWSGGFELQALTKSMEVIYNECKKLTNELKTELSIRGLNMDLSEKGKVMLDKNETKVLAASFVSYAVAQENRIMDVKKETDALALANADRPEFLQIIAKQAVVLKGQEDDSKLIKNLVGELEQATTYEAQNTVMEKLESAKTRLEEKKAEFDSLSKEFQELSKESQSLKDRFVADPEKAMESLKKTYPELASLSKAQTDYLTKSAYVNRELVPYLRNEPEKFVFAAAKRASQIDSIISKNGMFVEVNYCEQWTDKPIVQDGCLMHPKVADTIIKQAEVQIRGLKAQAEQTGDYFPYNKCDMTVYQVQKGEIGNALKTRVDIGDGSQTSLSEHLSHVSPKEFTAEFEKATREKGAKEKIAFNEKAVAPKTKEVKAKTNERGMSSDNWKKEIANAREKSSNEKSDKGQEKPKEKKGKEDR